MKPTYEELEQELAETRRLLKLALNRIQKLEEQINKNSKNSSKPPSSDQKGNTPQKERKPRPPRKGANRKLFPQEEIDRHILCTLDNCPHCGASDLLLKDTAEILQQVELPEVKGIITEYTLKKYSCSSCNQNSSGKLPSGVPHSAFGANLTALITTLTGAYLLPKRDAIQLVKDIYGIDVGLGSVPNIEERVTKILTPIVERIHDFVLKTDYTKHLDETTWRESGKRHYAWVVCNTEATVIKIYRSRGSSSFEALVRGVKEFNAVTDRYAVYNAVKGSHQYCFAHLIRDFKKYSERDGPDQKLGDAVVQVFKKACKIHAEFRMGKRSLGSRNQGLGQMKKKLMDCFADCIANGSDEIGSLSDRLWDDSEKVWAFSKHRNMDPTNNLAERNIRNLVIRRKRSYGTRSLRGKSFVECITTVCVSARQQGVNIYEFIRESVGNYFMNLKAPFLVPSLGF